MSLDLIIVLTCGLRHFAIKGPKAKKEKCHFFISYFGGFCVTNHLKLLNAEIFHYSCNATLFSVKKLWKY